ncbi:uncharacterized protein LOC120332197 [Styela clava]
MKIIVAGFCKTGTKTMAAVLDILGYTVYDWEHHLYYLQDDWRKILTKGGTTEDFYGMYKDIDVGVDIPFALFWEEVLKAFPESKIIFMQRQNEEIWFKSLENQLKMFNKNLPFCALTTLSYTGYKFFSLSGKLCTVLFGNQSFLPWNMYNGVSSTVALKRYRDHCTSVLTRAPTDRLLIFNMKDGWKPLCEFLNKDYPNVPFPHENERGKLAENLLKSSPIFRKMQNEMMVALTVIGIFVCYLLYLVIGGLT